MKSASVVLLSVLFFTEVFGQFQFMSNPYQNDVYGRFGLGYYNQHHQQQQLQQQQFHQQQFQNAHQNPFSSYDNTCSCGSKAINGKTVTTVDLGIGGLYQLSSEITYDSKSHSLVEKRCVQSKCKSQAEPSCTENKIDLPSCA